MKEYTFKLFISRHMDKLRVKTEFYFEDEIGNRKTLFEKALQRAKYGKVLYILQEELNELPELSQDLTSVDRNYIKMISFLYTSNRSCLIETLASLAEWQHIPSAIILDSLNKFTDSNIQNTCGLVALLLDSAASCSKVINSTCYVYLAVTKGELDEEYCKLIKELYCLP